MKLIKIINGVRLFKQDASRRYFIIVGDKVIANDIFEDAAIRKFNRVVIHGGRW